MVQFTQVVCFALFAKAIEEEKTTITSEDVKGIVDRAIELSQGGLRWFRDGLPVPERLILLVVANIQSSENNNFPKYPLVFLEEIGVTITEELKNAEKNLVYWNFCKSNLYGYQVIVELVRFWLIHRFSIDREIEELKIYMSQFQTHKSDITYGIECPQCGRHTVVSLSPNLWKCLNCDFSKDFSKNKEDEDRDNKNKKMLDLVRDIILILVTFSISLVYQLRW